MAATRKAVAVAAGAAAAIYYWRRRRRAEARRTLLATHTKIALLESERGAVVTMSPATSTVTFFKGSPRRVANYLRNKVAEIVRANPWLAARLDEAAREAEAQRAQITKLDGEGSRARAERAKAQADCAKAQAEGAEALQAAQVRCCRRHCHSGSIRRGSLALPTSYHSNPCVGRRRRPRRSRPSELQARSRSRV